MSIACINVTVTRSTPPPPSASGAVSAPTPPRCMCVCPLAAFPAEWGRASSSCWSSALSSWAMRSGKTRRATMAGACQQSFSSRMRKLSSCIVPEENLPPTLWDDLPRLEFNRGNAPDEVEGACHALMEDVCEFGIWRYLANSHCSTTLLWIRRGAIISCGWTCQCSSEKHAIIFKTSK